MTNSILSMTNTFLTMSKYEIEDESVFCILQHMKTFQKSIFYFHNINDSNSDSNLLLAGKDFVIKIIRARNLKSKRSVNQHFILASAIDHLPITATILRPYFKLLDLKGAFEQ
jgi:hypothetical protein